MFRVVAAISILSSYKKMFSKMRLHSLLTLGFAGLALALPAPDSSAETLGLKFDKRADELPTLTLPYATYQASEYDDNGDVRFHFFRDSLIGKSLY